MTGIPDIDAILTGRITEGQKLDFKRTVDLDDKASKVSIVDDVVAFLNADGGQILIGIDENRKTSTVSLSPVTGDVDSFCLRLQDAIKSNIAAKPSDLTVNAIPVEGGSVVYIDLGRNNNKPYTNTLNSRYIQRRGRKNEGLLPGEVKALHETRSKLMDGLAARSKRHLDEIIEDGLLTLDCPVMHISILPFAHLIHDFPSFETRKGALERKGFSRAHGSYGAFERVANGHEVRAIDLNGHMISRFFVGDDWYVHSIICHPIPFKQGEGRVDFIEMLVEISRHFTNIENFLEKEGVDGPFALDINIVNLHSREHFVTLFPRVKSISMGRPSYIEAVRGTDLGKLIVDRIRQSSIYG